MNRSYLFALFSGTIFLISLSCAGFENKNRENCRFLGKLALPGPEDFELDKNDPANPRLIVSLQERRKMKDGRPVPEGAIAYVNLSEAKKDGDTESAGLFEITWKIKARFHPHGISLVKDDSGRLLLYVINHSSETDNSIEIFEVQGNRLIQTGAPLKHAEHIFTPNDLVALPDGKIYLSNDHGKRGFFGLLENLFRFNWSWASYYDGKSWSLAGDDIALANGVAVNQSRTRLYIAAVIDKGIHVFELDPVTGKTRKRLGFIDVDSGVDNLMWENEHTLVVAGHYSLFDFLGHAKDSNKKSPSDVYRIILGQDGVQAKVERIFGDDGKWGNALSTAHIDGRRLYLSQVFDPRVVACELP